MWLNIELMQSLNVRTLICTVQKLMSSVIYNLSVVEVFPTQKPIQ